MHEGRSGALFGICRKDLSKRMKMYFDSEVVWEELESEGNGMTQEKSGYEYPREIRRKVIEKKEAYSDKRIVPYTVRPFDVQWAYYSNTPKVWNRRRENMWKQHFGNEMFLVSRTSQKGELGRPATISTTVGDLFILSGDTELFPFYDYTPQDGMFPELKIANLSKIAREWLQSLGLPSPDSDDWTASAPWLHMLSICNSPKYISDNEDALKADRPRFPVPGTHDALQKSVKLGEKLALILNGKENEPMPVGEFPNEIRQFGLIQGLDLHVTGWGHYDKEGSVQPNRRVLKSRPWCDGEKKALRKIFTAMEIEEKRGMKLLGKAVDIDLSTDKEPNQWCGIPDSVWKCRIGRYPVIRKWLSYRDISILGRDLNDSEARHVSNVVQRLTILILMSDRLDVNYAACRDNAWAWPSPDYARN